MDKLLHFQKHQYCPYHTKQNAKCTYDWVMRSAEFIADVKDQIIIPEVVQP